MNTLFRLMNTLQSFWQLAKPFWWGKKQWLNSLLMLFIILFALIFVRISVLITDWNKRFYDALAAFEGQTMPKLIGEYLGYLLISVLLVVLGNYGRKVLLFRWREHLTRQFEQQWLSQYRLYRLPINAEPDNPDQRIAEDIYLLAEKSIDLFKNFITNVAKLIAFIAILWQLSGVQRIHIAGMDWEIKGYLVWIAALYSLGCTLFTHWIGRALHDLNVERQHREADYRATLLRIRDHAEPIALYRGEQAEQHRLQQQFESIKHNWYQLIIRECKLESFSASYLRLTMFIPIIATLPMYLARQMTFGDMMQARSAFSNVQDGFGWFMDYYKRLMEWSAVVHRLAQFQQQMQQLPMLPERIHQEKPLLSINHLSINTPNGQPLLHGLTFTLEEGQWLQLAGKSGIGKTTVLRTLAGLLPCSHGTIEGAWQHSLFLPQKPYLPHDTLRAILAYPQTKLPETIDIQHILTLIGLPHLTAQLDNKQEWQHQLSGGEQQRISLARTLIHQPKLLFLDEASSQLDTASAHQLMHIIREYLPETACVIITHQPEIQALCERKIDLNPYCIA